MNKYSCEQKDVQTIRTSMVILIKNIYNFWRHQCLIQYTAIVLLVLW